VFRDRTDPQIHELAQRKTERERKKPSGAIGVIRPTTRGARPYWGDIFVMLYEAMRQGAISQFRTQISQPPQTGRYMPVLKSLEISEPTKRKWVKMWLLQFREPASITNDELKSLHANDDFKDAPIRNLAIYFERKTDEYRIQKTKIPTDRNI
jgi:hypothetical protein